MLIPREGNHPWILRVGYRHSWQLDVIRILQVGMLGDWWRLPWVEGSLKGVITVGIPRKRAPDSWGIFWSYSFLDVLFEFLESRLPNSLVVWVCEVEDCVRFSQPIWVSQRSLIVIWLPWQIVIGVRFKVDFLGSSGASEYLWTYAASFHCFHAERTRRTGICWEMDNSEAATYPICDSVCGFLSADFNSTGANMCFSVFFFLRGGRKMTHSYTFGDVSIYGWFRG